MRSVEVTVPASVANLGPGFDCLALTLSLLNRFTFSLIDGGLDIHYEGVSAERFPLDDSNLAVAAFYQLAETSGHPRPGLSLQANIQVPPGSGLGSSSTAVVAGLLAANSLLELGLTNADLLARAAALEGHADNAAAALYGGLIAVNQLENNWQVQLLPLAHQQVVVVVPELEISTQQMRAALPLSLDRNHAVNNAASLISMQRALAAADFELLRAASQVSFHQQARLPNIPGAEAALAAGRAAGGAVMLAGAGPSIIALAPDNHRSIAAAIKDAFEHVEVEAAGHYLETRGQGAIIRPTD